MRLFVAFATLVVFSVSASAEPHMNVQGLILGNEGARYVKGVPTLDLAQQQGAVQIRFLGFDHSDPVFAVAFFNAGSEPANIGLEDLHVTVNGQSVGTYTVDELTRQAKSRATWKQIGLALLGGIGAAASASQRDTYSATITGPYGSYYMSGSSTSVAGQIRANQIASDTGLGVALIQSRLDATIAQIGDKVIQRTTVDPGMAYGGLMVVQKLDYGSAPLNLRLDIDWNGERYPFGYLVLKRNQAVPPEYASMLASNAKPRRLQIPQGVASASAGETSDRTASREEKGAIYLPSGAVKIPAKTKSGYCLKTPPDYVATGAIDTPVITKFLPRCPEER